MCSYITLAATARNTTRACTFFRADILAAGTSVGHVAMWKYSSAANIHEPEDRWTLQPPCNLPNDGGISDIVVRPPPPILWLHLLFLVPNHFAWFGDYSVWSCPSVRVSVCPCVRVQKLFHHLLLAATSQEIDTYTMQKQIN